MTASPVIYGLFRAPRWSPNNEFRATGLLKILFGPGNAVPGLCRARNFATLRRATSRRV